MYSLSNLKGVFILYLFPLFSIILEIITSENYNVRIKLSEFSGFYLILILPLALVLIKKSYVKKIKLDFKFNFIHHLSIALFSVLLLSFLLKNINTFNIYEIGLFSEKYRNGFYKGSGLFTYFFLNIVPFLFAFQIIKQKKINKTSWL